ncbi:KAP family P-loop NTPase fold protein [Streptomyces chartreusis]|uniref:KAP family P-loop NTPase fold protein n=1 Tax=Streptomyces chartreusis TaxID=1969 RepID=UPI003666A846
MATPTGDWLSRADLIQDSEVSVPADDRLAHLHVAEQLQHLVLSVPTPTNVAVWGPWGSGKSGVANLLKQRIDRRGRIRFVRFDAFKYAENPLRRNFITAVATELGISDAQFHAHLYSGRVTAEFSFTARHARQLLWMYLRMFGLVCGVSLAAVALLVGVKGGAFWPGFTSIAGQAVRAGLAPAALLTSLAVLVSRTLTTEHKVDAAHSDEEFERIFDELVSRSRVERLVVFVDELDRCVPKDVVATLDALRTFLGVRRCVFVVAADQQVLEQALTEALEQATPADVVNPYYSSGSGYLDKVFQYQVHMPPLLMPQVTRFAADLVSKRGGMWEEVDVDLIVSILVPFHVRSPRRVKALLNAFALTYRLAQLRQASGLLETDVAARADEIARLVCLRVEFPLFARDLTLDHRMPQFVLALAEDRDADLGSYVLQPVREVALAYAGQQAPVDRSLVDGAQNPEEAEAVRTAQGQQLLDYLGRTSIVDGPQKDLIFMQTTGSVVGLASASAEALEQHAQNAALGQLQELLEGLSPDERSAALALLVQQVRAAMGVEAWNVAQSVLLACGVEGIALAERADAALGVITPVLVQIPNELPARVLGGAWRLALAGNGGAAAQLAGRVLRHSALEEGAELVGTILQDVPAALAADAERVADLLCGHLLSGDAAQARAALSRLAAGDAGQLMAALAPVLGEELRTAIDAADKAAQPGDGATAAAATADRAAPGGPGAVWPSDALSELRALVQAWSPHAPRAAHAVLDLLLNLDETRFDAVIEDMLEDLPAVREDRLALGILSCTARRPFSAWPRWLGTLDPAPDTSAWAEGITQLLEVLWQDARSSEPQAGDHVDAIAVGCLRLIGDRSAPGRCDLTDVVIGDLDGFAETDAAAGERREILSASRPFADSGLLDNAAVLRHEATALVHTLRSDGIASPAPGSPLQRYLNEMIVECLDGFDRHGRHPLPQEQVHDLLTSLDTCAWLQEPDRTLLILTARHSIRELPVGTKLLPLPDAEGMQAFTRAHPAQEGPALAAWMQLSRPSATDLLTVLTPLTRSGHPAPDRGMLHLAGEQLNRLPTSDKAHFWHTLLATPGPHTPPRALLDDLGWARLADSAAADVLIARFEASTNQGARNAVLWLWDEAHISTGACRRRLTEKVLLSLLATNQVAAQSALQAMGKLAAPVPTGTRKALRDAVVAASQRWSKLEGPAHRTMRRLGYDVERRGLFGRRQKIKEVPAD